MQWITIEYPAGNVGFFCHTSQGPLLAFLFLVAAISTACTIFLRIQDLGSSVCIYYMCNTCMICIKLQLSHRTKNDVMVVPLFEYFAAGGCRAHTQFPVLTPNKILLTRVLEGVSHLLPVGPDERLQMGKIMDKPAEKSVWSCSLRKWITNSHW